MRRRPYNRDALDNKVYHAAYGEVAEIERIDLLLYEHVRSTPTTSLGTQQSRILDAGMGEHRRLYLVWLLCDLISVKAGQPLEAGYSRRRPPTCCYTPICTVRCA
jgi:hypothetical protein